MKKFALLLVVVIIAAIASATTWPLLVHYEVWRADCPTSEYPTAFSPMVKVGEVSGEAFLDEGLASDGVSVYRIRAVDTVGNLSDFSSATLCMVKQRLPHAPDIVVMLTETGAVSIMISGYTTPDFDPNTIVPLTE